MELIPESWQGHVRAGCFTLYDVEIFVFVWNGGATPAPFFPAKFIRREIGTLPLFTLLPLDSSAIL